MNWINKLGVVVAALPFILLFGWVIVGNFIEGKYGPTIFFSILAWATLSVALLAHKKSGDKK